MAFIKYISFEDASPELQALYIKFGGPQKVPANIIRIAGHNPQAMEGHVSLYRAIMFGQSSITRHQREMIAVIVSVFNKCHY
ncbi:MAG: peroxidase [Candidatus Zixiibacteriota bacterium]